MITTLLFDFSRVILFPKDKNFTGKLNPYFDEVSERPGYRFENYFIFNDELLDRLVAVKDRFDLYMFTTGHIQNAPEAQERIGHIFRHVYSAERIPFHKTDPEGYRFVANELQKKPGEILFVDDQELHVNVARRAGLEAIRFENNEQLFQELDKKTIDYKV